jgi:hypothetical protein
MRTAYVPFIGIVEIEDDPIFSEDIEDEPFYIGDEVALGYPL